jgi:predicted nucleotidyltransferase
MNDEQLLEKIKNVIVESTNNDLISLYVIGSFLRKEMEEYSDIDLVGIMKPTFDFEKRKHINWVLNKRVRSKHRIDMGTVSYDEFFGGERKGSMTEYITVPVFIKFLKKAKLVYGKKIKFDRLPIKPATDKEELKYHIEVFDEYKDMFRKGHRFSADYTFRDFIKIMFYIANLELRILKKSKSRDSYVEVDNAFRNDNDHIVHYSMLLRRKRADITNKEKEVWFGMAEDYVRRMKKLL